VSDCREGVSLALERALREISRVECALVESGDLSTLASFGNPREGNEIAVHLGFRRVSDSQARVIDRLRWLPDAEELIREFLADAGAKRAPSASNPRRRTRSRASGVLARNTVAARKRST